MRDNSELASLNKILGLALFDKLFLRQYLPTMNDGQNLNGII